jgi:hypothetical protein
MSLHYVCCALCSIFGVAPVFAVTPSTPVTAVLMPDGRYSSVAIREMGHEASRILKESGVAFHWHIGTNAQVSNGLLVVVKLRGECDMGASPAFLRPGPLGWAHEEDGTVLPFSELACDNIRGAVQSALLVGNQLRGNVLLGRAMGRVLAHELYHIVADTAEHGRGVAQAALSPKDLTSGELGLDQAEVAAIQSGLRRAWDLPSRAN